MDAGQAKRLVLIGTAGSALVTVVGGAAKGETPGARVIAGTFIAAIILTAGAEFSPDIAAGLATVMLVTSLFVTGTPAWDALNKATGSSKAGKVGNAAGSAAKNAVDTAVTKAKGATK